MRVSLAVCILVLLASCPAAAQQARSYTVVDTGQQRCFDDRREVAYPQAGEEYHGQDAQYAVNPPRYRDNGDGTVTDLNTGLEWQRTPPDEKFSQEEAEVYAAQLELAGHDDWRLPGIKELFSIADLNGNMHTRTPYIDVDVFDFTYPQGTGGGGGRPGERDMDAQYATSTRYLGITMGRDESAFGFNFADGRIKSYPLRAKRFVRAVRGTPDYGSNRLVDQDDGTVLDQATGLVWQKADAGRAMNWKDALAYAEELELAGADDWRLPSVKELQSIVDYDRAPDARQKSRRGPALDPLFDLSDPAGWCWSSTTHIETMGGYYVCFGEATSMREVNGKRIDAHGAGAVRSDPKTGDPARWPDGLGPQADQIRILNLVRCVRAGGATSRSRGPTPADTGARADRAERRLRRLDVDADGRLSRQEFDGPPRRFDALDRNDDGFLSADELRAGR